MPRISPFVALRFDPERVGPLELVTAPPYDVISEHDHDRYLRSSPYNVTRLDLGDDPDLADDERDRRAAELFAAWRRDGILVETARPAWIAYEMRFRLHGGDRRIRGVVAAVELEEPGDGIVPHERTMAGPVEDRLRLQRALRANLSCIECVYLGPNAAMASWLEDATGGEPDALVTDEEGVEHRMWLRPGDASVPGTLDHESLMIADGHHRYATSLRYRDEMRREHGPGPWDAVMVLLIDATTEQPPVLPFHRIQLEGEPPAAGDRVRNLEEVLESLDDDALRYGSISMDDGALVHRVAELVSGEPPTVVALHEQILRVDPHALRFSPDPLAAEEAVRDGTAVAGYLLPATDAATIRRVVSRGERLPEKSTFFWPKPRTGLVLRPLDGEDAWTS